jgi:hypothetical protein
MSPHTDYILRYLDWIELQAVCFSRHKLEELIDTFTENKSGYGLPNLWYELATTPWGEDFKLFAVIDEVTVIHTRPFGTTYDTKQAEQERKELLKKWNIKKITGNQISRIYKGRYSVVIMFDEAHQKYIPECLDLIAPEAETILMKTIPVTADVSYSSGQLWHTSDELTNIKRNGSKVYAEYFYRDGEFQFDTARNRAKSLATRDWILSLDADERLNPAQHTLINELIEQAEPTIGGYVSGNTSFIPNLYFEGKPLRTKSEQVRLFRNIDGINWDFPVHESVELGIQSLGLTVKPSALLILHIGYEITKEELLKKLQRNTDLALTRPDLLKKHKGWNREFKRDITIMKQLEENLNGNTKSTASRE